MVASEGLGYALGIIGSTFMVLLLLYPLRKRAQWLKNAGPIKHWFRIHMILGVVGPVLVLFHSNFNLGSVNSRIALFCTIIVSSSGILGRYLYAKIHNGLYGQRLSFDAVRTEIQQSRNNQSTLGSIKSLINEQLQPIEDRASVQSPTLLQSLVLAMTVTFTLMRLKYSVRHAIRKEVDNIARSSDVLAANQKRLLVSTLSYLDYRLSILRNFAQLQACERLFSLWHVVHYPLFMVLVVAAIVHIIAVHMY